MKKITKMIYVLLTLLLICFMDMTVLAAGDVPDLDRTGSVSVVLRCTDTGELVSGGALALYRVADAVEDDGNFSFAYTDVFENCGYSLEDIQSETLASSLADWADENKIEKTVRGISAYGTAFFPGLQTGLYLITQQSASEGYNEVKPFLVSVPIQATEGSGWVYDVDAGPKVEIVKGQPQTPVQPSDPRDSRLPQTGQLNWPVPVLTIAGVLLFSIGWFLNTTKRTNEHEG